MTMMPTSPESENGRPEIDRLTNLVEKQNKILEAQSKNLALLQSQSWEQIRMLEVLGRIELRDVLQQVRTVIQDRQLSMMETMDQLASGKSIARWGDGEIKLMVQPEFDLMYQKSNSLLAQELRDLIVGHDASADRLMLGLPTVYTTRLWMGIWAENWHVLYPLLRASRSLWGNTHISRPPFFQRHGQDAVAAWRRVWEGKRVCVVAGRNSRFELLPELFDNVDSVIRVDSEPSDAYVALPDLKKRLIDLEDIDIFLLALGPSGTIMAGHLSSAAGGSHQAIDIGHLASSFLNVFKGGKVPEQLPQTR